VDPAVTQASFARRTAAGLDKQEELKGTRLWEPFTLF